MTKYKKNVGAYLQATGVSFRVWAPFAEAVSVRLFGEFEAATDHVLKSEGDGYWHSVVPEAVAGQEYRYVIRHKGEELLRNDPRARGITSWGGNSIVIDSHFEWEADAFVPPAKEKQIYYELHIGTFNRPDKSTIGTFRTAIEKLDHLQSLGINMIELMPINTMRHDRGWGYDPHYIYAVEALYGGPNGLKLFVKEAHKRNIGVVLDVVYNHFNIDEKMDLWRFDGWYENDRGGIYFYNDERGDTPWGSRPDFGRPEVRQYLLDNVRYWIKDCHLDGLRVDSTLYLRNVQGHSNDPDGDLPEAWTFLQDLNRVAKETNENAIVIAEDVGGNEFITKPAKDGGAGFDAQWEVGMPDVFRAAVRSNNPGEIDLEGLVFEISTKYNNSAFQKVGYCDSHDSAANGSARINQVIAPEEPTGTFARQKLLMANSIVLTTPLMPMLFQGQEFSEEGEFTSFDGLDWKKLKQFPGMLIAHQHLGRLRKNLDNISAGLLGENMNISHRNDKDKVLVYHRWLSGGPRDDVVVIANFADSNYDHYDMHFPRNGTWKVRFNSSWKGYGEDFAGVDVGDVNVVDGRGSIRLPGSTIVILSQDS